jgi:hypothetical protein
MVKTIGLTLGYTRQWRRSSCRYLDEGSVWSLLGLDLQGENPRSNLCGRIGRRRRLRVVLFLKAPLLENLHRSYHAVKRWLVRMVIGVCHQSLFSLLTGIFSFFCLRLCIASVFNDFAICRRGTLCACVSVGCVHLCYAEAGCVLTIIVSLDAIS